MLNFMDILNREVRSQTDTIMAQEAESLMALQTFPGWVSLKTVLESRIKLYLELLLKVNQSTYPDHYLKGGINLAREVLEIPNKAREYKISTEKIQKEAKQNEW